MTKKKKEVEEIQNLKPGHVYRLAKIWIKKGSKSGIPVGSKRLKLSEIPTVGRSIMGKYETEHHLSGDPKEVSFIASTPIVGVKPMIGIGWRVETQTSVYLILFNSKS